MKAVIYAAFLLIAFPWVSTAQVPDLPTTRAQAELGEPEAQFLLGLMYYRGEGGLMADANEAARWYRMAADQGHAKAQSELGFLYENGHGVPQDYVEAVKYYRFSADQGWAWGENNLGWMYASGRGVKQDFAEAAKWYRRAAEQGLAMAQLNLGLLFAEGRGVTQDYVEAAKWFHLAALQDLPNAARNRDLAVMRMTDAEVAEAERRVAAFKPKENVLQPVKKARSNGSGFFVTDDGYLLTGFHVVTNALRIVVRTSKGSLPAKLVKTDPANDLALLKVDGVFRSLPIASSRQGRLGDQVFTIGFPNLPLQGIEPKLTSGEINSLAGIRDDLRFFQTSVPAHPGNSGGALINTQGNVIGMLLQRLNELRTLQQTGALPQNVNYALKGSYLKAFLESVPEVDAKLREPFVGGRRHFEEVMQEALDATVLIFVN